MKINPLMKQFITETILKTSFKMPSRLNLPPTAVRFALEQLTRVFPQPKGVVLRSLRIAGIHAEEIKPQASTTQMIFHIHGGAFFVGSLKTHRAFLSEIALRTQMQVLHVDYPLAPDHPYPEASDAIYDIYQMLMDQGVQAKDIIVSGDSCGANLALALALKLKKDDPEHLPSGLILMSPFLDLTLTSESLRYNQKHDALLSVEALETGISYYVPQGIDASIPEISPIFGDFKGLPPTLVQVGSKEILMDDAIRFEKKAKKADVDVTYKLYTGMWHNFQMFSPWFDEAKKALADIADFAHRLDQS
ncbi:MULTISPECIES: alpha/beta hydrolase [Acinetobacter]|uniref:Alpha/beta hydrolase n=1 Tax=Acinetobacter piscicola TaxID=2006115 RepID=A0A4Q4H5Z9_9GAMM|nr:MULTISPECIES: alpha/beta hydrolase [Acinetobacter]MDM1757633.1 alpha/beta hydrolase [Acinetobacter sp. 256-1]MDM1761097.1 alpha/beta hydrolase [Acinetobacter sp. 251-1]QOW47616.1 alpha/beta hydrolase [Acinetobacter piscicola]RYL29616.1 alpha/beta hydrolase [Acinetobacter piscicola]